VKSIETTNVTTKLRDQVITITGGTGSFGNTMARYALEQGCREVRIFSRDEAKQDSQRHDFAGEPVHFYLGDVRDASSLDSAFQGTDLIFHAAALKQVPSCEFFPMQAIRTNIDGSANVLERASQHDVRSVVCLSTDKAVYPINAMGMTKALMEKLVQAWARANPASEMVASVVRYGNVMYSRGSVLPLFIRCILQGRPLPVTEPSMTRFLMPLRDAVSLVEFALVNARSGEVFIRKAPASTIGDLASAVIELFEAKNSIDVIGFRHGEKLYETLATREELQRSDDFDDYYRVSMDARDLDYSGFVEEGQKGDGLGEGYHSHNTIRLDRESIKALLCSLPQIREDLKQVLGEKRASAIATIYAS
jgi:UDP-glucose 4-epimerase